MSLDGHSVSGSMPISEVRKMVEFAVERARSTTPENMCDEAVVQLTMRRAVPAWKVWRESTSGGGEARDV